MKQTQFVYGIETDISDGVEIGVEKLKKSPLLSIIDTDAPPSDDFTREYCRILRIVSAQRSPWEVLGIPDTASGDEVRKAYGRLLNLFHPDRNPSLKDTKWEQLTTTGLSRVKEAYEQIREEIRSEEKDTLETKLDKLQKAYVDFLILVIVKTEPPRSFIHEYMPRLSRKASEYLQYDFPFFEDILGAYSGDPYFKPEGNLRLPRISALIHKINDSIDYLTNVYRVVDSLENYNPQPKRFFSARGFCAKYGIPHSFDVALRKKKDAEEAVKRAQEEARNRQYEHCVNKYGSFFGGIINWLSDYLPINIMSANGSESLGTKPVVNVNPTETQNSSGDAKPFEARERAGTSSAPKLLLYKNR